MKSGSQLSPFCKVTYKIITEVLSESVLGLILTCIVISWYCVA